MPPHNTAAPLSLSSLTVYASRIQAEVQFAPDVPRMSSPELIRQILAKYPHIADHACVNEHGERFADVMNHTSLAHVLEHMVIDAQVRMTQQALERAAQQGIAVSQHKDTFVGTTEWINKAAGVARVQVSFADDLVALAAFRQATDFLNDLLQAETSESARS